MIDFDTFHGKIGMESFVAVKRYQAIKGRFFFVFEMKNSKATITLSAGGTTKPNVLKSLYLMRFSTDHLLRITGVC